MLMNLHLPRWLQLGPLSFLLSITIYYIYFNMAKPKNPGASIPLWLHLGVLVLASGTGYAAYRRNAHEAVLAFCTGPGSYSRILFTLFLAVNWKSLPFAWSVRQTRSLRCVS